MKKVIALFLSFAICISLCACSPLSPSGTITYNEGATEMYYNGRTYIDYGNTNGKYRIDLEDEAWVELATLPYGYFYILGAVTVLYGNNAENPDYIANSRTTDLYVREDLTLDHNTDLSICDTAEPFCFTISDVTTGNSIEYILDQSDQYTELCNFFVALEPYSCIKLWITIWEFGGSFYLQDAWNSDYYEITDAFKEEIYRLGLNAFDYH